MEEVLKVMSGNIRRWLETAVETYGEPLEAVVVGQHYNRRHDDDYNDLPPAADENVVLSPAEALVKVDEDFYSGFGGADCFPIYAWTQTRVFFIHEYDGATGLAWLPRHPLTAAPEFSGRSTYEDNGGKE